MLIACAITGPAKAGSSFFFSTGDPDGKMATASRPGSAGKIEIESADDFVLTTETNLTSATFTGLLPTGASLSDVVDVRIEIYRVFPNDSDVGRTSGPPTFSTPQVPTRVNSPSDVEFDDRSASADNLTFTPGIVQSSFTAANSVLNGIHPKPNFHTGGDGAVTGQEVQFNVLFSTPFYLPADHYFFVPQVQLTQRRFLLALGAQADRPAGDAVPGRLHRPPRMDSQRKPGSGLAAGRNRHRGGSPAPTFNATFSLSGSVVPEPSSVIMLSLGSVGLLALHSCDGAVRWPGDCERPARQPVTPR